MTTSRKRDPSADGGSPLPHTGVGSVLGGKYRVERVLGSGGMGVVVAAQHLKLRQTVAIKLLLPKTLERPHLASRMVREARAAAALKSEHVARVFNVDALPDGAPYIVMEYLQGETLASLLERQGRLGISLTVEYALQICQALAEAHALGIVHRDLKPANLFLAQRIGNRPTLRVLDFGIAKALGANLFDSAFTTTDGHGFVGSPRYISPEQLLEPGDVDARADIWSLGVVLYECLSGRVPFDAENLPKLWDSILREPAPPLGAELELPLALRRIVDRCLEKERDARYPNVVELARDLVEFGPEGSHAALVVIEALFARTAPVPDDPKAPADVREGSAPGDATHTEAPTTRSSSIWPGARRRSRRVVALLVAVPLLLVLGAVLARRGTGGTAAVGTARSALVEPRLANALVAVHPATNAANPASPAVTNASVTPAVASASVVAKAVSKPRARPASDAVATSSAAPKPAGFVSSPPTASAALPPLPNPTPLAAIPGTQAAPDEERVYRERR